MPNTTADPQFGRGQTLGGGLANLSDPSFGVGTAGMEKTFMDQSPMTFPYLGIVNIPNRYVRCIALRNSTGGVLTRGQLVKFRTTDALGFAVTTDQQVAVVDEYLTGNVPVGEVFWGVIQGPTSVVTAASPAVGSKLAVGTAGAAIVGIGLGEVLQTVSSGLARIIVGGNSNSAHIPT